MFFLVKLYYFLLSNTQNVSFLPVKCLCPLDKWSVCMISTALRSWFSVQFYFQEMVVCWKWSLLIVLTEWKFFNCTWSFQQKNLYQKNWEKYVFYSVLYIFPSIVKLWWTPNYKDFRRKHLSKLFSFLVGNFCESNQQWKYC